MQQMHSFKGIYYLIQNIGLLRTKIVYRDQCITYFKWLKLHVLRSKHDEKKIYVSYVHVYQTQNNLLEYKCKICTLMLFFFVDDSITFVQCNFLILKIIMKWFISFEFKKSLHTYKVFTDHMKLLFGRLVGCFFFQYHSLLFTAYSLSLLCSLMFSPVC